MELVGQIQMWEQRLGLVRKAPMLSLPRQARLLNGEALLVGAVLVTLLITVKLAVTHCKLAAAVAAVGEVTTTALVLLVAQVVRLEEAVVALVAALRQAAWVAQAVEAK